MEKSDILRIIGTIFYRNGQVLDMEGLSYSKFVQTKDKQYLIIPIAKGEIVFHQIRSRKDLILTLRESQITSVSYDEESRILFVAESHGGFTVWNISDALERFNAADGDLITNADFIWSKGQPLTIDGAIFEGAQLTRENYSLIQQLGGTGNCKLEDGG